MATKCFSGVIIVYRYVVGCLVVVRILKMYRLFELFLQQMTRKTRCPLLLPRL